MRRILSLIIALVIIFGLTITSYATLIDMGDGTVYDTDTQLSWLKDAGMGGKRTWLEAGTWAGILVFAGFDNWRLPIAVPSPGGPNIITYSWTASEMGHIYYTELKNDPANLGPAPPLNPGPFTNLE